MKLEKISIILNLLTLASILSLIAIELYYFII
jgi:hypothetical protein